MKSLYKIFIATLVSFTLIGSFLFYLKFYTPNNVNYALLRHKIMLFDENPLFVKVKDGIDTHKELENDTVVIDMQFIGTTGPGWIAVENRSKLDFLTTHGLAIGDTLLWYIEAHNPGITSPGELTKYPSGKTFRFTGQFYKSMQYQNYEGEEGPAVTFLYYDVELVKK